MTHPRYVVITPVRNEVEFIGQTIHSVAAQTLLPRQWVIVDDGSTDATGDILLAASRNLPWLTTLRRPDRGFRKSGGGVVEAFYDGYAAVREANWDFLVKLDGDLSLEPDYFERCLAHFAAEPRLGIGGGTIYVLQDGQPKVDSPRDPPFHVRGATKVYRRECWEQIHPLLAVPGWDTIDEVKANMYGWATRTFPELTLLQHRTTGAVDGRWANWFKNGVANYATGYHPAFMLAKCVRRSWDKPRLVAAAALWAGFCSGYLRRHPRVEDEAVRRYLRKQQLRRLLRKPSIYATTR